MNTDNINKSSLEFDGINYDDAPDFCDAYVCYAEWNDGTELDQDELDELNDSYRDYWYDDMSVSAFESLTDKAMNRLGE